MGYKYGVWFIYNQGKFNTKHIGHITIACFMTKADAVRMAEEINKNISDIILYSNGKYVLFEKNYYENDDNNIMSWGYNFNCKLWNNIKNICEKYKCSFSNEAHTSIEYGINSNSFKPYNCEPFSFNGDIKAVDITSDKPEEWKIIN